MSPASHTFPWHGTHTMAAVSERASPNEDDNALLCINVINFLLFLGSSFVVVGIGAFGLFGFSTIRQVSEIYPTLMTPAYWVAPTVWILLLASLAVWAGAQLLPKHRNCPLQVEGVRYYYTGVALSQFVWTMTFSYQIVFISLFAALSIMVFLLLIGHNEEKVASWEEFWIHKFPFSLYTGWTIPLILWNVNVILADVNADPEIQYYVAIVSIATMGIASTMCLTWDYVIPLVIAFFTIGIWIELYNPSQKISIQFTDDQIFAVQTTAAVVFSVILLATPVRVLFRLHCAKEFNQGRYDDDVTENVSEHSWDSIEDDEEMQRQFEESQRFEESHA